ncbi:MAG: hypothetical protein ACLQIB_24090 [Isosphaeraceae bacterium]
MNPTDDAQLWNDLHRIEQRSLAEIMHLWGKIAAKADTMRAALGTPHQRGTALRLLLVLGDEMKMKVFRSLVELSSVGHSDVALCRSIIKSMPRRWVLNNIESIVRVVLQESDGEEEYRRFAELYVELDGALLERHVQRALAHPSEEVREVGSDFEKYL